MNATSPSKKAKGRVIAIGLDSADPELLQQWMSEGKLPNLAAFQQTAATAQLSNVPHYRAETPWTTFLTGCFPETTEHWGPIRYDAQTYDSPEVGAYAFDPYPPFYALGGDRRVAIFDMPQVRLCSPDNTVNGIEILGWGSHSQQGPSCSHPPELLQQLRTQYGHHPAYDEASQGTSDHANCYDAEALLQLKQNLLAGIARRTAISKELLRREPWDFFLTLFAETHSSGHSLWHLSRSHPLFDPALQAQVGDAMLEVFQAVDRAVGELLEELAMAEGQAKQDPVYIAIFSAHGMQANALDVPSMLFMPEFMYRWNFGRPALGIGNPGELPPPRWDYPQHWKQELWQRRAPDSGLASPNEQRLAGDSLSWMPANWYKPLWPAMRAFALPSYSEGQIRINLEGREVQGRVSGAAYALLCDEIAEALSHLVDARTGQPMVSGVIRTRQDPYDSSPELPPADLIVKWQEQHPTDVVEGPEIGRIGPVPYFRTGGHRSRGVLMVQGTGLRPGLALPQGKATDLPATLLTLMGVELPDYFEGESLANWDLVDLTSTPPKEKELNKTTIYPAHFQSLVGVGIPDPQGDGDAS